MSLLKLILRLLNWLGKRTAPGDPTWRKFRRRWLPPLDGYARKNHDRPLIRDKTERDDERIARLDMLPEAAESELSNAGYHWNLPSTLKYLEPEGSDRVWEWSSWVKHDGEVQYHAWLFKFRGQVWLYHHRETSYLADPEGHQGHADDPHYEPGDPDGTLPDRLTP